MHHVGSARRSVARAVALVAVSAACQLGVATASAQTPSPVWLPPLPANPGVPAGNPPAAVPGLAQDENVPAVQQPDYSRQPVFDQFFADPAGSFERPGSPNDNVSVAVGDGNVFVA